MVRLLLLLAMTGCYDLDAVPRPGVLADAPGADAPGDGGAAGDVALDPYAAAVLADSPIGYWRLGEATGGTAVDETGAHHGTYVGAGCVKGAPGITSLDTATSFEESGCHVEIESSTAFDFAGNAPFTVECWMWRDSQADWYADVFSRVDGDPPNDGFNAPLWHDQVTFARIRAGAGESAGNQGADLGVGDGWHHVVAVYDGNVGPDSMRLYVDGSPATDSTNGEGSILLQPLAAPFVLGDRDRACSTSFGDARSVCGFVGTLDECALYDTALPQARILAHAGAR
jgi:hypothetical protein